MKNKEIFQFEEDIRVGCIRAASFPEDVVAAHEQLHELMPPAGNRQYFGISFPREGKIIYSAAARELLPGEAEDLGLEQFTIRQGAFIGISIPHFRENLPAIGLAFQELLAEPSIDPQGYCLEWYPNDSDVRCLVPLSPSGNLAIGLEKAFNDLLELVGSLSEEELNALPFPGSWTAGQVADHLYRSYGVAGTMTGNTSPTKRPPDAEVKGIRELFLDFNIKFQSPPSILPSSGHIGKDELLKGISSRAAAIMDTISNEDLSLTCLDFAPPGSDYLTRLEWGHFVLYHTQRHIRQLKKIIQVLKDRQQGIS